MTALAVSVVRAHGVFRSDTRDDLATYNAYLARLDSQDTATRGIS